MARPTPAGPRAHDGERDVLEDVTDCRAAEGAPGAEKRELERINGMLEQRLIERTAELEAEAKRRATAETRLLQAQKMELIGRLTGGIAHDFNNILQVITGSLEVVAITLKRGSVADDGGEGRALIERVTATAQRAALNAKELVQRLLAFTRRQPSAPAMLDVNALIGDMTEIIRRALGETIAFETALAADVRSIYVDRDQLESVLLNLVVNARDAMGDGGRLRIATADEEISDSGEDALAPGPYVTLSVSDTGCGIPSEHLNRVFEPHFTTKDAGRGSGLGLSMVYDFVKQSGGRIRIRSESGAGTSVKIYLPVSDRSADESARDRAPEVRSISE